MKKLFRKALLLICGLFSLSAAAQFNQALPLDSLVRTGVLPNGLTYYIRYNATPKGQADFYIAQKVGSILENDEQRGLAHFLEHMCFNGTKNFPGNQLIDWLETKGVKFGQNLNAYTGLDETVYNISNVPVANEAVQDSCLLILHDWADDLLLDPAEIDKERGVIHEEWRMRNVGQQRILENILPTMYPESKYGHRLPIGTMEVVDNFPYQALRDYYEAWYRPDLQGIIVVGDINPDRIEAKIKEMFSPIQMPENAREREQEEVMDTDGTIYAIGSDPECPYALMQIFFKTEVLPREYRNTPAYLVQDYITDMITSMLNSRFSEMQSNPETPFAQAYASYGPYLVANTEDAFAALAVGKGNDLTPSAESLYREILRAQRGGFTFSEYDRARSEYLSRLEKRYNNRNDIENDSYSRAIVRSFIDGTPLMNIEDEYQLMNMLANQIPVDAINQTFAQMITPDNRVVMVMTPQNDEFTVPTEEGIAATFAKVEAEDIEPFKDEVKAEPLIPQLPAPGSIVKEETIEKWGATKWTLSNGVEVIVKPTNYKADEILFDAQAIGGTSVIPDSYANSLIFLPIAASSNSLGDYTNKDLQKYLQGKQVQVAPEMDAYTRDIAGTTTPKDLPTMMELIYMTFTNYGFNNDEFLAMQKMIEGIIKNQSTNPEFIYSDKLAKALFDNPRKQQVSVEAIEGASAEQSAEIIRRMTANAADYTFFFVGSIDLDTLRPLVEQYIATLPADKATATTTFTPLESLDIKPGDSTITFNTKMETPQVYVTILEYGNMPFTPENYAAAKVAGQILSKRFLKNVREDMNAVYSIWATCDMRRVTGKNNTTVQSYFPMKPELKQQVLDYIAQELKNMESDVTPEEVAAVVEFSVKTIGENKEKNEGWLNAMGGEALNGVDTFTNAEETYKALTPADVQNFMKELNAKGTYRVVLMEPAE